MQWTTGNVGRRSVIAAAANPGLELVGCYAWGADKVGRDVGELCGIEPLGILATDDVDALLALQPDCVVYNPKWPDVDEMVRILEAGVNIVSTAAFITGHSLGDGRDRIVAACERGGASDLRERHQPRVRRLLAIVSAGICDRVDSVSVLESADSTGYDSPDTELPVGFGRPIDDPALPDMAARRHRGVRGRGAGSSPTRSGSSSTTCAARPSSRRPPRTLDLGSWTDPRRLRRRRRRELAGLGRRPQGGRPEGRAGARVATPRARLEDRRAATSSRSRASRACAPGSRSSRRADFVAKTFDDFMVLGMIMTAHARDRRHPRGRARRRPASSPTSTCRSITPRGFVPPELSRAEG